MRHIWKRDDPTEGMATCQRCGIPVKEYRIKLGGITACREILPENVIIKEHDSELLEVLDNHLVICGKCGQTVPDAIICIYCGVQRHPLRWVQSGS